MSKINLFAIIVTAILLVSCNETEDAIISDPSGVSFMIILENHNGDNLLNPHSADNLVEKFDASIECDGKTYDLDWSITQHPLFMEFPSDKIFENVPIDPDGIPGFFSGFRYYVVTNPGYDVEGDFCPTCYPANYFLCFGDFDGYTKWSKKMSVSFPSFDKRYDIVWKNDNYKANVTVNGERIEGKVLRIVI